MDVINKIAVLLTCHNRKDKTLTCLNSLFENTLPPRYQLEVFLVDDGSSDGTADMVKKYFPSVKVIQGDGNLFWNRGMKLAWDTAIKDKPDFYLWLNDDVSLKDNAIISMIETYHQTCTESAQPVIIGNLCDKETKVLTYGGYTIEKGIFHFRGKKLDISGSPTPCDKFNGNVVLIPKKVVDDIGILDERFTHAMGDFDYGLRCKEAGIPMFATSNFIATCSNNSLSNKWSDSKLPFRQRLTKLLLPTGLPPREYFYYIRKHTNLFTACVMFVKLMLRLILPNLWRPNL